MERPALQDLLAKCQQDKSIDMVIVQETDRLARNTQDHLAVRALLQKAGVRLFSVAQPMLDDSPEGKMIDTIIASVNQFQSDINSRKTKKGLQEKFDSGWWPGWAPLGYLSRAVNGKKTVGIDPERWHLVREGFRMYLTGNYSVLEIVDTLYDKGLRSKTGKKVPHSIMVSALKNPFYAGVMKWNGQEKPGKHKSLITLAEHKQILGIMDAHNQHACRRRKHRFLLRGFVKCDICNQRYVGEKHSGKGINYYHCSARSDKHSNLGQNIEAGELEKQVTEGFKKIQFSEDFVELVVAKVRKLYEEKKLETEQSKKILVNRKMHIERRRDIAEDKLIGGTLVNEDYVRIRERYRSELVGIQNEIDELEMQREIDMETIREVLQLTRNIYGAYKEAPYEIKRLYLGFFWDGFWVRDKKIVKAKPTKLLKNLLEEKKVILRGNWLPSSAFIRTIQDWLYMGLLKARLSEIRQVSRCSGV